MRRCCAGRGRGIGRLYLGCNAVDFLDVSLEHRQPLLLFDEREEDPVKKRRREKRRRRKDATYIGHGGGGGGELGKG